jgi:hypothetical protein
MARSMFWSVRFGLFERSDQLQFKALILPAQQLQPQATDKGLKPLAPRLIAEPQEPVPRRPSP